MFNKSIDNYITFTLILALTLCTVSFAGCSNKRDETKDSYLKIVEASNEFGKVKNGKILFLQKKPKFEKTIEFIRTDECVDWIETNQELTSLKYIGDKTYTKDGNEWVEGSPRDKTDIPAGFKQFTQIGEGDSKTNPNNILSIMVNKLDKITEYEVRYDAKLIANDTYENAYKSFIQENPWLTDDEIAEIWDAKTPSDYELDSAVVKYGVDENNVLVYIDSYMSKDKDTYNTRAELVEYNIENFNPF